MLGAVKGRATVTADAWTVGARNRVAVTELVLGSASTWDRVLARGFFELAAPSWRRHQTDADRIKVAEAALDATRGTPTAVVELGCGAGELARRAAVRWPDASVIGYDVCWRMVRCARGLDGPTNLRFERRDAHAVRARADLVLMQNYLPHPAYVCRLLADHGSVAVISSFQTHTSDLVSECWRAAGFERTSWADIGCGSYEIYRTV